MYDIVRKQIKNLPNLLVLKNEYQKILKKKEYHELFKTTQPF
jgi:hypothetical protein